MAMTRRSKLIVIALIAAAGVAAQPMILGSQADRCMPTSTDAVVEQGVIWVANGASSPGIDWINLEVEDAPIQPGTSHDLPGWLVLPDVPGEALERRVGTIALGWPVRWSFCRWVATDPEQFFPPITQNEEPCQSLRRAIREWGHSADGASVQAWWSLTGVLMCWLTIAAPMALVVLLNRQSDGKSGKAP